MKRAIVSVGLLLLSCSAAFAASTPRSPDLQTFLALLKSGGPTPIQAASKGGGLGGVVANAYCQANCYPYSNVSCSGATCSSVDRNCGAGQQGYVQCDGVPTFCPAECGGGGNCQEGSSYYQDGGCCHGGYQKWLYYECIEGNWQQTDTICDSVSCY